MSDESADMNPITAPTQEPLPTHSEDGVDLTLIRWMLSLTPLQRLRYLQRTVGSIVRLRHARSRS
jgi:hypothetical protein